MILSIIKSVRINNVFLSAELYKIITEGLDVQSSDVSAHLAENVSHYVCQASSVRSWFVRTRLKEKL